jgi:CBS domain-containing protein
MKQKIAARDLMTLTFLRLGSGHTLREALGILLDPQAPESAPRVLIVLNPDGTFAGTLSTRFLLRALVPEWVEREDESPEKETPGGNPLEEEADYGKRLLHSMQERLNLKVGQAMNPDVPTVGPGECLPRLIELIHTKRLDCLPVLDNGRVVGVVYVADIFNAAAQLALQAHHG